MRKLAIGAASGLVSTLLNGTILWFVLELYRELATSVEETAYGGMTKVHPTGEALVAWQVLFYATMVLSLCTTVLLAAFLARRFRTPHLPTVVFTLFLVGLVVYPFLHFQSYANDCELGHAFPLAGTYCD
jgi:hypothetical protein